MSVCVRALVRVGAGPGRGSLGPELVRKRTPRSGPPSGQKSSPVKEGVGRGVHWELLPLGSRGFQPLLMFSPPIPQDIGGEDGSPPPTRRASPTPKPRDTPRSRFRRGRRRRARRWGPRSPAARGWSCRWKGQAGRQPGGPWGRPRRFGRPACILFCFDCVSKWPRVPGAGRAQPEVASPTRAKGWPPPAQRRRPAARRELKFKCDSRQGRELATAREGPQAQEACAFKGPARSGRARRRARAAGRRGQRFSAPGSAPQTWPRPRFKAFN